MQIEKLLEEHTKKLLEKSHEEYALGGSSDLFINTTTALKLHKQNLKQFIDGLVEETENLIVNTPESLMKLNAHLDSRSQEQQYSRAVGYCEAIATMVSHLKEIRKQLK